MKYELKCADGTILVDDDKVIISKKNYKVTDGKLGDRALFYSDINGVEFKKSGLTGGYIKFIVAGTNEVKNKSFLGGARNKFSDQNNLTLIPGTNKKAEEIYNFIMKKIAEAKKGNGGTTIVNQSTNLDELKKLAELKQMGAISDEEFEEQKSKLLNN